MDYGKNKIKTSIISPGFSVDCLETLEEIKIQYKELLLNNGGENFIIYRASMIVTNMFS